GGRDGDFGEATEDLIQRLKKGSRGFLSLVIEEGQRMMPSVVAYTKVGDLPVGQIAKRRRQTCSERR
ncbi:hypothetical protein U1Q18_032085, partial [Sarracenia purpurea var. burkii]